MTKKRPIDILRDSAGSVSIGSADDPIVDFLLTGGSLHVIKEKSIHQIKMADEIDPKRTNPSIPNTHQQVLSYGADCEIVARTLLTAKELFNPTHLGKSFDHQKALDLTFDALKNLIAMHEIAVSIEAKVVQAQAVFDGNWSNDGSLQMPSVGDLTPDSNSFFQKAYHVLKALLGIVKLFYGQKSAKRWFESLKELAEGRYGKDAPFAKFMRETLPFLQFIPYARNAIEHPKPNEYVKFRDYSLDPKQTVIMPPTIELVHPKIDQQEIAVTVLMGNVTDETVMVFESMIAHLCKHNLQKIPGLEVQVGLLPEGHRPYKNVQIGYHLSLTDPLPPPSASTG